MKALVTGGAGFIGHHVVDALVTRGDEVVVLDNLMTGHRSRLAVFEGHILIHEGDVRDPAALRKATDGAEVVFHLAALPSVQRSVADPTTTHDINAGGTVNVMQAAAEAGVRRVILSGSSSVYGSGPELPRRESQSPDPQSPYAVSKLAAEGYSRTLGNLLGVEAVVLRYFNVFGPGQDPSSMYAAVVPRFVTAALSGQPAEVHGDGLQSRDFTYVDNVVHANLLAASVPAAVDGVFNVGCGDRYTLIDLLEAIADITGSRIAPRFGPPLTGDVRDSQADISLATQVLGYEPSVDFLSGLTRTVQAYRGSGSAAGP